MTRRRRQLLSSAEDLRQARDLDNIAHFEPRRETVGDLLRRAREGKGQALEAVATRLRIRALYLKAIEDGRFQDLPGLTYAVGFVRTYADHLGLDAEDVVRRFRDEVTELKSQTQLIFPVAAAAEGKIPRGAILLLSAFLAAIAYGGWYYLSEREQSALDLIPELPAKLKALVSGEEPATPDAAPAAPPATVAETAPAPVPGESAPAEGAAVPGTPSATTDTAAAPATDESLIAAAPDPVAEPAPPAAPVPAPDAASDPVAESAAAASALPSVSAPSGDALTEDQSAAEAALLSQTPPATGTAPSVAAPEASLSAPGLAAAPESPPPAAPTVPNLDASGLPTVAAPAAPTTGNLAGLAPATDAAGLPAITDGQAFGATEGPSRIVLVARLESWVQVTDPETNALLTRVLRAGDRFYVPDQAGLSLATGNAGGLDIWVDGRKAPVLGPVGVVRRGVTLDPQRLVDGTAVSDGPALSE